MQIIGKGTRFTPYALLLCVLFLSSNDGATSSNPHVVVHDPTSSPGIHDSNSRPVQQHSTDSAVSDWDESVSSGGCSENESEDRNDPGGSKCARGAGDTLSSLKQSAAARVQDTLSGNNVPDTDHSVGGDPDSHLTTATVPGSPSSPPPRMMVQRARSRISGVLLLTLKDAPLAKLLMTTLRACGGMDILRDFFVVVPGGELSQIESILLHDDVGDTSNGGSAGANSPERTAIVMVDETELLRAAGVNEMEPWWQPYSLQMILKLLASSLVRTPFYLTLDADVLCTKDGLSEEDLLPQGKGNYVPEGRHVHSTWWSDAAQALGVEEEPLGGGFGVTPAVLSKIGAELVLERLRTVHGNSVFLRRILDISLTGLGGRWTEYTMYRTALDHSGVFDALHAVGPTNLVGDDSVWYSDQFDAWNVTAAFDEDPAAFVVVQSTAQVGVPAILRKIGRGLDVDGGGDRGPAPGSAPSLRDRIVRQMWPLV